jgi:hypothetical protein
MDILAGLGDCHVALVTESAQQARQDKECNMSLYAVKDMMELAAMILMSVSLELTTAMKMLPV